MTKFKPNQEAETLYEHAGGEPAIHRLEGIFHAKVLADPVLKPLLGNGRPEHVDHLTAFTAESFGGRIVSRANWVSPIDRRSSAPRNTRGPAPEVRRLVHGGVRRGRSMPNNERFRASVRSHVEFGSQVAMQNSDAKTNDDLHPLREVPHWTWEP